MSDFAVWGAWTTAGRARVTVVDPCCRMQDRSSAVDAWRAQKWEPTDAGQAEACDVVAEAFVTSERIAVSPSWER